MKKVLLKSLNLVESNLLSYEEKKQLRGGFDLSECGCWEPGWVVCEAPMSNSCDDWCGALQPPGNDCADW